MRLSQFTPHWLNQSIYKMLPASIKARITTTNELQEGDALMYVSREDPITYNFKRYVLRKNPHLYRVVTHLTDHCNLKCKGCTHFSNIAEPAFTDLGEFRRDMERMAKVFDGITEIYLLGGEPLLHEEVISFMEVARKNFPKSERINLMSNGLLVPKMSDEFFKALHDNEIRLVIDLYPVNIQVEKIDELGREYDFEIEWVESRNEFFKLPIDLSGSQDPEHSFKSCGPYNNCVLLREGRLYPCAYAAYSKIFMEHFGFEGLEAGSKDSISIYDEEDPYKIMDFLMKPVPWCRFCNVDAVSTFEWSHDKAEADDWLE